MRKFNIENNNRTLQYSDLLGKNMAKKTARWQNKQNEIFYV